MDEPRGKILRDYAVADQPLTPFNLPRQPGSEDRYAPLSRNPSVGEVRGTSSSMGPAGGGGGSGACNNFSLSDNETDIDVSIGQVGSEIIAASTVAYGTTVYVQVTLNASDGTYTAAIVASNATESDTVKHILIGSSNGDGSVVTQNACGPFFVTACPNWFVSPVTYSFSIS